MTKTAEKRYPLGPHIPIQPIEGSTPRDFTSAESNTNLSRLKFKKFGIRFNVAFDIHLVQQIDSVHVKCDFKPCQKNKTKQTNVFT